MLEIIGVCRTGEGWAVVSNNLSLDITITISLIIHMTMPDMTVIAERHVLRRETWGALHSKFTKK